MPFLADQLWANLVRDAAGAGAPASVFLAGWPAADPPADEALLADIAEVRSVVELGRQARAASQLTFRQPLRRLVVQGANGASRHVDEIRDELRVKEVDFGPVEAVEVRVKPNLPVLGPKLGKALAEVRQALAEGRFEQLPGGRIAVGELTLGPDEVLVERSAPEGWAIAEANGLTVALATTLDDELLCERRVLELIHRVNTLRKEAGLELTDRIVLTLPSSERDLALYEDSIKRETLAVELRFDGGSAEPRFEKA
jgi:isoleucyl-tRNA synthetase